MGKRTAEKDGHPSSVPMDKWSRSYVRWAGRKKVRRALSSLFSAVAFSTEQLQQWGKGKATFTEAEKEINQ